MKTIKESLREQLQDYAVLYIQALEDDEYKEATKQTKRIMSLIKTRLLESLPERMVYKTEKGYDELDRGRYFGFNEALDQTTATIEELLK